MKHFLLILVCQLLITTQISFATTPQERYQMKVRAERGEPSPEAAYGLMLLRGDGGPVDLENGLRFLRRSVAQRNPLGYYNLASALYFGWASREGRPDHGDETRTLFQSAADHPDLLNLGKMVAEHNFATMALNGDGGPVNLELALAYYLRSALSGYAPAQRQYAGMVKLGKGLPPASTPEEEKKRDLLSLTYNLKAAKQDDALACGNVGLRYLEEKPWRTPNRKLAAQFLKKAVALDDSIDSEFFFAAGVLTEQGGDGITADPEDALKYYEIAGKRGHEEALNNQAALLLKKGDPRYWAEARQKLLQAASLGSAKAAHNYAILLENGVGGPVNPVLAEEYYRVSESRQIEKVDWLPNLRAAAARGQAEEQGTLGKLLFYGLFGVEKDEIAGFHLIRSAAEQKDPTGMFYYATFFVEGRLVTKNLHIARELFKASADHPQAKPFNSRRAEYRYAWMVYKGEGGPRMVEEALEYFKRSAYKGYTPAKNVYSILLKQSGQESGEIPEWFKFMAMAAEDRNPEAYKNLGTVFLKNRQWSPAALELVRKLLPDVVEWPLSNVSIARRFYELAIERADETIVDADLLNGYGALLLNSEAGPVDLPRAFQIYKRSAEQGSGIGSFNCGVLLEIGFSGADADVSRILNFYEQAFSQGYPNALNNSLSVALRYDVQDRLAGLREKFKKATDEFNSPYFAHNYAMMCERGLGGDVNIPEAEAYYARATALGGIRDEAESSEITAIHQAAGDHKD